MAIENVKKFFELVKSDEELAREIAKIKDEIQNKGETVDYEQIISKKVIPMAKKHGLDFTMEDFLKYTNSMVQQGELSDDDLLNVSGGMNFRQGLATGLLMLTVGTTGLSLMGNLTAPGGDGSGSGGAAPTTSYSQSIDNGTEDEEVVDTESDEREDNEFNDEDDAVPATEGVSMDMLGAGESVSTNKDVTGGGVVGGAAKSATATKATAGGGVAGGAAKSATATKATAGGGVAGGAAKSTTATKTTAGGGAGAGGAAGATTTKKEEAAKPGAEVAKKDEAKKDEAAKPGAEAAKKDEAKKDEAAKSGAEAAKKDETKEETKTETGKKSEEAKKDEAAKTEATEKQEYNKFGDKLWYVSSWSAIGKHIYGEMEKVGFKVDNFSNKEAALSEIKAYVEGAETKFKEGSEEKKQYDKIKTSYDNYTAEVAKKEIKDLVESIKRGNYEEATLEDFGDNSSINEQGITWKGCVLSGEDATTLLDAYSADYKTNYEKGKEFTCALYNEDAQNVEDAAISELKDLLDKLNEGIKDGKTAAWPQELKDRLENFRTGLKDLIAEKEEAAKKEAEAKKAAEEAAKKEADAVKKVEYTGLKRDVLTLKSFADKVETVNELARVLKDSGNGKNMTAESRAKLEADTLKLGFVLFDVKTQSFDVQGDDGAASFENGDEANIHAVENYYKEISKDLKDFNDKGITPYKKAENLVKELNEVNGEWYRVSPKTVKTAVQRINEVGNKIGQDDEGYYVNTAKFYGTTKTRFGEGEVEMIKTAADELANLAKK